MVPKPARRVIMRIELTPVAKESLMTVNVRTGMTQVSVMSRVTEWFARQDVMVQGAVLGHYPAAIEADVAKLILKQLEG